MDVRDVMGGAQQNATPKKARRPHWAKAFLGVLCESGNVRLACTAAKVDRSTAYRLRERDETFADDWSAALDEAAELLEAEARRRAYDGWDEPVFGSLGGKQGSGQIGMVRKYSDTLLIFLLKGAKPETYRERVDQRVSGGDGRALTIRVVRDDDDRYPPAAPVPGSADHPA